MKHWIAGSTIAALFGVAMSGASAQGNDGIGTEDLYWGVGLTQLYLKVDDAPDVIDSWEFTGGSLKLGLQLTPRFSLEARGGYGGGDTYSDSGNRLRLENDYWAAALGRFNVTTGGAQLYLLGGVGHAEVTADLELGNLDAGSATDSDTTVAAGVGLDLFGTDNLAVNVEFLRLLHEDDYYVNAGTIGFTYHH